MNVDKEIHSYLTNTKAVDEYQWIVPKWLLSSLTVPKFLLVMCKLFNIATHEIISAPYLNIFKYQNKLDKLLQKKKPAYTSLAPK